MNKTKEEYETKIRELEKQEEQLGRQLKREENRMEYFRERAKKKRNHRLIVKGGVIESILPELKDVDEKEFYNAIQIFFEDNIHKSELYSYIGSLKERYRY